MLLLLLALLIYDAGEPRNSSDDIDTEEGRENHTRTARQKRNSNQPSMRKLFSFALFVILTFRTCTHIHSIFFAFLFFCVPFECEHSTWRTLNNVLRVRSTVKCTSKRKTFSRTFCRCRFRFSFVDAQLKYSWRQNKCFNLKFYLKQFTPFEWHQFWLLLMPKMGKIIRRKICFNCASSHLALWENRWIKWNNKTASKKLNQKNAEMFLFAHFLSRCYLSSNSLSVNYSSFRLCMFAHRNESKPNETQYSNECIVDSIVASSIGSWWT